MAVFHVRDCGKCQLTTLTKLEINLCAYNLCVVEINVTYIKQENKLQSRKNKCNHVMNNSLFT